MADVYAHWRDALAGKPVAIHDGNPQPGFYKMRKGKDGPWQPVAIWPGDDGALICRIGPERGDPVAAWSWCSKHPIAKDVAQHAFKEGSFPGDVTVGHNSANASLLEQLADCITSAREFLAKTPIATTKVEADTAANYRAKLLDLKGKADKERDEKVRPHLDAQRQINGEYNPTIKDAEGLNVSLRNAMDEFAKAEARRIEAERRKAYEAEQARVAAERKRIEEERAKKLADDPIAALTEAEPELPMAPPPPEPVKVQLGGQGGRVSGLRTYYMAEITDYAKALQHYAEHPDVKALVQKLADADSKSSKATCKVPGVRAWVDKRVA